MSADVGGKSDPYITISYKGATHKTDVKMKTLNPVFETTFEVPSNLLELQLVAT